jgi:hypothetical protein
MEMEGRGATKQARGSSAGSSASSEVSGEPVLAGEDEEASVVAESPHPDDEGRRRNKRKRAPAAAPPPQGPWPPRPPPPLRPEGYVRPRYEGVLNRDLVGSAGGKLPVHTAVHKRAAPRGGSGGSNLGFHLDGAEKGVIQDSVGTLLADHLCEFARQIV